MGRGSTIIVVVTLVLLPLPARAGKIVSAELCADLQELVSAAGGKRLTNLRVEGPSENKNGVRRSKIALKTAGAHPDSALSYRSASGYVARVVVKPGKFRERHRSVKAMAIDVEECLGPKPNWTGRDGHYVTYQGVKVYAFAGPLGLTVAVYDSVPLAREYFSKAKASQLEKLPRGSTLDLQALTKEPPLRFKELLEKESEPPPAEDPGPKNPLRLGGSTEGRPRPPKGTLLDRDDCYDVQDLVLAAEKGRIADVRGKSRGDGWYFIPYARKRGWVRGKGIKLGGNGQSSYAVFPLFGTARTPPEKRSKYLTTLSRELDACLTMVTTTMRNFERIQTNGGAKVLVADEHNPLSKTSELQIRIEDSSSASRNEYQVSLAKQRDAERRAKASPTDIAGKKCNYNQATCDLLADTNKKAEEDRKKSDADRQRALQASRPNEFSWSCWSVQNQSPGPFHEYKSHATPPKCLDYVTVVSKRNASFSEVERFAGTQRHGPWNCRSKPPTQRYQRHLAAFPACHYRLQADVVRLK